MGLKNIQHLDVKYDPDQIEEKKEIWDNLEDLKKRGIIEDWELKDTEEVETGDKNENDNS